MRPSIEAPMIPFEVLIVFIPAALALNLTPGNDMMFCLGQGLRSGPEAGIAASLGITAGGFVHTFAAAAGLAALLAEHPAAFEVIRWAGAAYLVFLAIQALRSSAMLAEPAASRISPARAFRDAMVVNVTNPKIVVFVFAFLPQFVDPERGSSFLQFVLLGSILNIGGLLINGAVGARGQGACAGSCRPAHGWCARCITRRPRSFSGLPRASRSSGADAGRRFRCRAIRRRRRPRARR